MNALIALELRKNRMVMAGLSAAFGASLPLAALMAAANRRSPQTAVDAALLFWVFLGLPPAACLIGGVGGAGLRGEFRGAEAPLPISPQRRAAGGALAAVLVVAALGALVAAVGWLASPQWRAALEGIEEGGELIRTLFAPLAYGLVLLAASSFTLAYGLGHAAAGGILGGGLGGFAAGCLLWGSMIKLFLMLELPFAPVAVFSGVLALGGTAAALRLWAPAVERSSRLGPVQGCALAAGLIAGALSGAGALTVYLRRAETALSPLREGRAWASIGGQAQQFADAGGPWTRGMLAGNIRGDLVRVEPDGRREILIEGRSRDLRELLRRPWRPITSVRWGGDGTLWVLADDRTNPFRGAELWRGRPGAGFSVVKRFTGDPFPHSLERRGREVGLLSWRFSDKPRRHFYASPTGEDPRWEPVAVPERFFGSAWAAEGRAARLSEDARFLRVERPKPASWILPGRALAEGGAYLPAYRLGRETAFFVPVALKEGGRALAVCLPGGKVRLEWRAGAGMSLSVEQHQDGTIWGPGEGTVRLAATPGGEFLPPFRTPEGARVLRARAGRVWLLASGDLVELDPRSGRELRRTALPKAARQWGGGTGASPREEGFFYQTADGLDFVDWDGRSRRML